MAAVSALFNWYLMIGASLQSFGGAPALLGNRIQRSVWNGSVSGPGYSAAIEILNVLTFFEFGATATEMVFPF